MKQLRLANSILLVALSAVAARAADTATYDVVVYGGTS
jgi:hypothetical protein